MSPTRAEAPLQNDVNILVCTGGRQRSETDFRSLYAAAGLALSRIITTDLPYASIIEGVPHKDPQS